MTASEPIRIKASAAASPEEAAAIVAALERFMRATAPTAVADASVQPDGWHAAAVLEGVSRDPWGEASSPMLGDPWINP
jgi:hypothetical protein